MRFFITALIFVFLIFFGAYNRTLQLKKADYITVKSAQSDKKIFFGKIKAQQSAQLSFRSEGRIVFFPYTRGDFVRKNQVIARLDGELYAIRKKEEQAKLEEYYVQKRKQEKYYKRLNVLHREGAISDNDWESAYYELKSLTQQINAQKEKVNYLKKEIAYNVLVAPFDAFVSDKFVDVDSFVKIGAPVVALIDSKEMQAEVMVDEEYVNSLKLGQKANIEVLNYNFDGKIAHISKSSLNSGGYLIKIVFDNKNLKIKEGMSAKISFDFQEEIAYVLPINSIVSENKNYYVYKITDIDNGVGKIKKEKIFLKKIENDKVEILEGIKEGDVVVKDFLDDYYQNQKVKL